MTTIQFIAEVSSNHNRDIQRCLAFIDQAAAIGCHGIKFQLFKIDQLFAPEILLKSAEHRRRRNWELPADFIPKLAKRCEIKGIKFICTPFYLSAVDTLLPYIDIYKIASYELLWQELLEACAGTGKPVILSTGMATMEEVRRAVTILRENGCENLMLTHCISAYPVHPKDCNLTAIATMREEFSLPVGWSDHSTSPAVIYRAVHTWKANIVEFHLDLDGHGKEFSGGHCWLPDDIQAVISTIQTGITADGSAIKQPSPAEKHDRNWRAAPEDGLRPMPAVRKTFMNRQPE